MNISKEQILRQISFLTSQTCERHHISPDLQTSQRCTHSHTDRQTHMEHCLWRAMPLSPGCAGTLLLTLEVMFVRLTRMIL